jgi:hypothetical protein
MKVVKRQEAKGNSGEAIFVGWVEERNPTQHRGFVGFHYRSTQPTLIYDY